MRLDLLFTQPSVNVKGISENGENTLITFVELLFILPRACPPVPLRLRKPGHPPKFLFPKTVFTLAQNRISEDESDIKLMQNGIQIGGMVGYK